MLKGWNSFEKWLLIVATLVIMGLSVYWGDSYIGMISSITGVICVIMTAKGSRNCYIYGLINIVLYIVISYSQGFYGEVMLNGLYYLPMQFIGWFVWSKNIGSDGYINPRRLTVKNQVVLAVTSVALIYAYGLFLSTLGGNLPYMDSMSTVLSVLAMYLSVKRYMEQWIIWIVVNVVSIIMWVIALVNGSNDIATLLMWTAYLVNATYGFIKWNKESKQHV